jgi:hypothetical protein
MGKIYSYLFVITIGVCLWFCAPAIVTLNAKSYSSFYGVKTSEKTRKIFTIWVKLFSLIWIFFGTYIFISTFKK